MGNTPNIRFAGFTDDFEHYPTSLRVVGSADAIAVQELEAKPNNDWKQRTAGNRR